MGDAKNKASLQRYFRGIVEFHGIKTPELNSAYRELTQQIEKRTTSERIELARCLLSSSYAEEKGVAGRIRCRVRCFAISLKVAMNKQFGDLFLGATILLCGCSVWLLFRLFGWHGMAA